MSHQTKENVLFISGIDTNVGKTVATTLESLKDSDHPNVDTDRMRARIGGYRGTPPNPRDTLYRRGHARVDLSLYLHLSLLSPYGGGERWKTYRFRHDHPIHPAIARDLRVCITGRSRRTDGSERHGIPYDRLCEGTGVSPDTSHVRINHTVLSLYACERYGIEVKAIVYNQYPSIDPLIEANTLEYLKAKFPEIPLILLPEMKKGSEELPDIRPLL